MICTPMTLSPQLVYGIMGFSFTETFWSLSDIAWKCPSFFHFRIFLWLKKSIVYTSWATWLLLLANHKLCLQPSTMAVRGAGKIASAVLKSSVWPDRESNPFCQPGRCPLQHLSGRSEVTWVRTDRLPTKLLSISPGPMIG